jgi:serine/threonine protein kinase
LKTLAGAPLDTESARAFLQRRVLFLAKLFGGISIGLHVLVRLARLGATRDFDSLMGPGPQPAGSVVRILEQVVGALSEAHSLGLIHRDIKPANVILCERGGLPGFAKVVDFGLVKSMKNEGVASSLSGMHTIVGTPLYLSPEQIATPESVDARSDLYALGALAYFLLAGVPVFEGG